MRTNYSRLKMVVRLLANYYTSDFFPLRFMHDLPPSSFITLWMRRRPISCETLHFTFFFSNSVPRILKCRVLIGKLVHNVRAHLHCCPITANEVLVQQIWIALGAFRPIPASCSTWKHLHVVLSLAITPLANSFLSQHFYCICCTRQTAIKPR